MEPELREPGLPATARRATGTLRTGWTTGTCSAAAAKAATLALLTGLPQERVEVGLPRSPRRVTFEVARCRVGRGEAEASVVKDAGDDPDVTHGAELVARVAWAGGAGIRIESGAGVGVVTKPGLGLPVGGPAINPVPSAQITQAVWEALGEHACGLRVTISVPGGERLAKRTTNPRLGILGGISILGTTGIVRPFSTAAWRASVGQAIDVIAAQGLDTVVLSTGGRTERAAMRLYPDLEEVQFVEVGDFTGYALRRAVRRGLRRVAFVGMAGKLAKLAAGVLMTHWTRSRVEPDLLACLTQDAGGDPELVRAVAEANTARHAFELWAGAGLAGAYDRLCAQVARNLSRFVGGEPGGRGGAGRFRPARVRGEGPGVMGDGAGARIAVIGFGADGRLAAGGWTLLARASLVVGGRRHLERLAPPGVARVGFEDGLGAALDAIASCAGPVAVLASGDPGFFGIVRALAERFGPGSLTVVPALSSVAAAFARAGLPWDDALVVSVHGRDPRPALNACRAHPKVAVLTSPDFGPAEIARALSGLERRFVVAERLGEPGERVVEGDARETADRRWEDPNVVIVHDPRGGATPAGRGFPGRWTPKAWALPEEAFSRRAGLITKAEVRALALARLGPGVGDLVWDIGAGSGSVAVECARLGAAAVALDRDPAACEHVRRNAERHGVEVEVVCGEAPDALGSLPDPDAAFVGGGGAALPPILERCAARVSRTVVVALATLERVGVAEETLRRSGMAVEGTMLHACRLARLGDGHRLVGGNPIVVLSGVRR